jgi:uncharacterized protein YjbI with pentapeptide repeats
LHALYHLCKEHTNYSLAYIFDNEIFLVEFKQSVIVKSQFQQINFNDCYMDHMIIKDVEFKNVQFYDTNFSHTLIKNCIFDNVSFIKNSFANNKFVNCCFVDNNFDGVGFSNCIFISCVFSAPVFYQCKLNLKFIDCHFINWQGKRCQTSLADTDDFRFDHFKLLCKNCYFDQNLKASL